MAERYGGAAVALAEAGGRLPDADVVVASTSARGFVLARAAVEPTLRARKGRPLFFIDIAVPRDVDPAVHELEGCYVYDIDDLEAVVTDSTPGRAGEVARAEAIVAAEAQRFAAWRAAREAAPAIASLRAEAEEIRVQELERARGRLGRLTAAELDVVDSITARIVDKLLHRRPYGSRKRLQADWTTMLLRVGTRGSRLALTQAGLAADLLRAHGRRRDRSRPDHDDRRPRPPPAVRRDRRARRLREGARGGLAGRPYRRRRPFGEGHDVDRHRRARRRRVPAARGCSRRARRQRSIGAGDAYRHGVCAPPGAAARARAVAVDRAPSWEHRHASRKRSERGLDAIVLAACGLDRLGLEAEVGHRFEPADVLPEAGQGALALQVREGEEEIVAAVDDAETRRRVVAERACVAEVGGGCLAPVAAYHDGDVLEALVADEDGRWIERRRNDDPVALARELLELAAAR